MRNVQMKTDGNTLTIVVDLAGNQGRSKSGKTVIIATTGGNQPIPNSDAIVGLNIYKKA